MKKVAILVASILIAGNFGVKVFADEVTTSYKEQAGITPDSILYPIDTAVDNLRVTLTSSEEKEAALLTDIAEERLGESEVMAEENKIEEAEKALEDYNEKITEAADKLQEIVNTTDENVGEEEQAKIDELEKDIQEAQEDSLEILDDIQEKVGEENSEVVDKIIETQTAKKEAVAAFVKERHELNAARKNLKMAEVELKKIEKSGDAEAAKKAEEALVQYQEAYNQAKTELNTAFEKKQQAVKKVTEEKEESKDNTTEEAKETIAPTAPTAPTTPVDVKQKEAKAEVKETPQKEVPKAVENVKTNDKVEVKEKTKEEKEVKVEENYKKENEKASEKSTESKEKSSQSKGKK